MPSNGGRYASEESRIFDAIYDPLFIVTGKKDAWRANTYSLFRSATPIHVLSQYNLMFSSDLPKESQIGCLRSDNFLPHFRSRGGSEIKKEESEKKLNYNDDDIPEKYQQYQQCSRNNAVVINLSLDIPYICNENFEEMFTEEKMKNVGCQTIYRESSAQTRPYQPDALLGPGEYEEPEILRISKLITGDNQPGEFEAKIIDRARRRREWEKSLPKINTEKEIKVRNIIIEAFEWEQWISREEEIENVQNMRLELVMRLLQKRNRCFELKSKAKIEITRQKIEEKRTVELQKLEKTYDRKLRKLEGKHMKISKKYTKTNIVEDHIDFTSELYAPQMRFGENPNRGHYIGFRKQFNERLDNLDKKIKKRKCICSISKYDRISKPKEKIKDIIPGFTEESNLKIIYEELKSLRITKISKQSPKCIKLKTGMKQITPDTPITLHYDISNSTDFQAVIYLQKVMKGRAVQNILFRLRQKYKGLIDEIQSTKIINCILEIAPERGEHLRHMTHIFYKLQQRDRQITKAKIDINNILTKKEASIIGTVLEFLKTELKRLHEQRKVHAIYLLAEKERKKRETFEQIKRQRENIRRIEHEEIYRNLMKTSRDVVTFYLENVLIEETNLKAENDARYKVETLAKYIDKTANTCDGKISKKSDECEDGNVISSAIEDFIYPEIKKRLARKQMELRQRKYLLAAHRELYTHIDKTFTKDHVDSGNEITDQILQDLIDKAIDSEYALTELTSTEDVAHHEALAAIKKMINRVLPGAPKWKSSAERIVSATVSELTKLAVYDAEGVDRVQFESTKKNKTTTEEKERSKEMLEEIVFDITDKLWNNIYEYKIFNNNKECKSSVSNC